jgi:hypothetical protein
VFAATLIVGTASIAAIAAAPLYASRLPLRRSAGLGAALVLAAVGLGFAAAGAGTGSLPLRAELALVAFPLLLAGALLLLAADGGSDDGGSGPYDEDPPWWPEFEQAFRRYSWTARVPARSR